MTQRRKAADKELEVGGTFLITKSQRGFDCGYVGQRGRVLAMNGTQVKALLKCGHVCYISKSDIAPEQP